MSNSAPPLDYDASPAIGALLRLVWQAHRDSMFEHITAGAFPDVTRAQFELIRWPGLDGMRPGEVARLNGLSKQTVNDLLRELEQAGYIQRHPHPKDGRARVLRLTPRGEALQRTVHETSRALETAWAAKVGAERFAALRATLEDMVANPLCGVSTRA